MMNSLNPHLFQTAHVARAERYDNMEYRRCGRSGLKLPRLSLGLWHNFGGIDSFENGRVMIRRAFDLGINHFDLANNYGPPPGSAEEVFGAILAKDLRPYRDELIISSKAGYRMWPGPHGEWGSRKYLLASLDRSLQRMGLEYVDIFYSHRPDPETPLEETMGALSDAVKQGKALYVGISSYSPEMTSAACGLLRANGTPCLIHQPRYSMFNRGIEHNGLLQTVADEGIGVIAFSPLAQGILTNRYLNDVPHDSRIGREETFLKRDSLKPEVMDKVRALHELARGRGESLAQLALKWATRDAVTSALIGASKVSQIEENVKGLAGAELDAGELAAIDEILG